MSSTARVRRSDSRARAGRRREEDGAGTGGGHGLAAFGGIRLVTVLCIVGHGCIQAPVTGVALGGDGAQAACRVLSVRVCTRT